MLNRIFSLHKFLFYSYSFLSIFIVLAAFYFDEKALLIVPFGAVVAIWAVVNFKSLYFFLLALIPLSIEFDVTSGLGTDLPTEPLMIGFLLITILYLFNNAKRIDFSFFKNPLIILLILHVFWLFISAIFTTVPLFSAKFILAKLWYISTFLIVTSLVIENEADLRKAFWFIFIPLSFTVFIALVRHALTGFDFTAINPSLRPFYRNHVNYAAILAVFLPYIIYARTWYKKYSFKYNILVFSVAVYFIAIYFSYTRASYLAVVAMLAAFFVFRLKLTKWAITFSFILLLLTGIYVAHDNRYLSFAPSTSTVSQQEFDDLVTATFKAEDVSSMERIYRWLAALHMIEERPIVGFGPNSFVENYKNYTLLKFQTWISTNEERSGVHNYFLMTATEQGIVGLSIFLALLLSIFIWGEKVMHKVKQHQRLIQTALISSIAILVNLFFSDMIEVDKTGSFFFFNIAILVLASRKFKRILFNKSEL